MSEIRFCECGQVRAKESRHGCPRCAKIESELHLFTSPPARSEEERKYFENLTSSLQWERKKQARRVVNKPGPRGILIEGYGVYQL
jgi:hypothetical protein